jgi:hypothetical protein
MLWAQDMNIIDAPAPRPDQLPMGASRNTWPNIVNNKVCQTCHGDVLCRIRVSYHVCVIVCYGERGKGERQVGYGIWYRNTQSHTRDEVG